MRITGIALKATKCFSKYEPIAVELTSVLDLEEDPTSAFQDLVEETKEFLDEANKKIINGGTSVSPSLERNHTQPLAQEESEVLPPKKETDSKKKRGRQKKKASLAPGNEGILPDTHDAPEQASDVLPPVVEKSSNSGPSVLSQIIGIISKSMMGMTQEERMEYLKKAGVDSMGQLLTMKNEQELGNVLGRLKGK